MTEDLGINLHGGDAGYGIAGQKVLVKQGEKNTLAHFTGIEVEDGAVYLRFHTTVLDSFTVPAADVHGSGYTEGEDEWEKWDEVPVLVCS